MRSMRNGNGWLGLLPALLLALAGCTAPYEQGLVGQWTGRFGTEEVNLMLGMDHRFSMQQGQRSIHGLWRTYAPRHPEWLDLWVEREDGQTRLVPLLARPVDKDHLRIRVGGELKFRPTRFAAEDGPDQATLARAGG